MAGRKIVSLPPDLEKAVENFRFENRFPSESEAIRRLLELGWETCQRLDEDVKRAERAFEEARKCEPSERQGIYLEKLTRARDARHNAITPKPDRSPLPIIEPPN